MGDRALVIGTTGNTKPARAPFDRVSKIWYALAAFVLTAAAAALAARVVYGPSADGFLMAVAVADTLVLALRVFMNQSPTAKLLPAEAFAGDPHKNLLDSTGPAVAAIDLNGRLTYMNPSAERMLGYKVSELIERWENATLLAPGEIERVLAELQKLSGTHRWQEDTKEEGLAACLECIRSLPPSTAPAFEVQLVGKHGDTFPVMLHISALRDASGELTGLAIVALERGTGVLPGQPLSEIKESRRDQFEYASEMIGTLDAEGRFLYANPAWERTFGLNIATLLNLNSFVDLFIPNTRGEVTNLFQRALSGETVDRAPMRHYTLDGRLLELELSLGRRKGEDETQTVRCVLRDVTLHKQREKRLALQLAVSQIVGENISADDVSNRILEALCVAQGWDLAIKWEIDPLEDKLCFNAAWGTPGPAERLIEEARRSTFARGDELPGRAWKEGRPVWIADLSYLRSSSRAQSMRQQNMISGWAAPIRVGKKVFAVLEFYCRFPLREDREAESTVETVTASLGQILYRTQERGRAEELSRQQEILLDSVTEGICGIDPQGRVSFANPAAGLLLGVEPSRLTGMPVHDILHGFAGPRRRCGDDCPLRRAAERHMAAAGEENAYRADGSSFPTEYVLTPMMDHGRISGSVISFRDISQRFALDRLKDEFISTVSHELRTPLTSIRGALGLLSSGVLDQTNEKASHLLRIAQSNSDRLVRLINDILDLERIQSGREPLTFRPIQLNELVCRVIEGVQPVADSAGVKLIQDSTQVEVSADADRLEQVVTNLLSNAIKFSPPNSSISVMLRPGVNGVTLSVIDQGRGIPADKLETIFGRFQQVDASDSRQKGGSGLGLAICRTIVQQHSGRIWAERNPLRGSTFRVFLPYHPEPTANAEAQPNNDEIGNSGLPSGVYAGAQRQASTHVSNS